MRKKSSILATLVGVLAIGGWLIGCNNSDDLAIQNNNGKQEMEIPAEAWEEFAEEQNKIVSKIMTTKMYSGTQTRSIISTNKLYDRLEALLSNFITKYAIDTDYDWVCASDSNEITEPSDSTAVAYTQDQLDLVLANSSEEFNNIISYSLEHFQLNLGNKDIISNIKLRNIEKLKLLFINSIIAASNTATSDKDKAKQKCEEDLIWNKGICTATLIVETILICATANPASAPEFLAAVAQYEICTIDAQKKYNDCLKSIKKK